MMSSGVAEVDHEEENVCSVGANYLFCGIVLWEGILEIVAYDAGVCDGRPFFFMCVYHWIGRLWL